MNSRRNFLIKLAVSAPAALGCGLFAQTPPPAVKLEESDPVATALGYKEDGAKVDAQKYPQYKPDQKCSVCALYTGKPGEATGPCTAFQNKIVNANGWCAAFAKKPEPPKP
jgi:hypothetical protein